MLLASRQTSNNKSGAAAGVNHHLRGAVGGVLASNNNSNIIASSSSSSSSSSSLSSFSTHAKSKDNFISGASSLYAESMFEMYENDPNSVPEVRIILGNTGFATL
jgi:hypothetical protein